MDNKYSVDLYYGCEESNYGVSLDFEIVDPTIPVDTDKIEERLAESLDVDLNNESERYHFNWNFMSLDLPESLVQRIKEDAIREYLAKESEAHEKGSGSVRDIFSVSAEVCNEIVDAALRTIRGVGVDMGSGCYELNSFDFDGEKLNLYVDIMRQEDEKDNKVYYGIYYAVEYDGGDNLFSDWAYTCRLDADELKEVVFEIANRDFSQDIKKCIGKANVEAVLTDARERYSSSALGDKNSQEYVKE